MIINNQELTELFRNPYETVEGSIDGNQFKAKIAIPNYEENVARHYDNVISGDLNQVCLRAAIPFEFQHFGLICEFEKPIEILAYDENHRIMDDNLKEIIRKLGAVILRNVFLNATKRKQGHRARFRQLAFHRDRGPHQPEHYSLYFRDPFDDIQKYPRTSSTLFIANIVAYLQLIKEHKLDPNEKGVRAHYEIFENEKIEPLIDGIVLEHSWTAPEGTGEISSLDNHTALHASYYRTIEKVIV